MTSAGELIRAARRQSGLSQVTVARRAGVTQSVVSLYERGRREPSLPTLERLVGAAGARLRVEVDNRGGPTGTVGRRVAEHREEILAVLGQAGVDKAWLFGNVARGEDTEDSDLDLLVRLPESGIGLFGILTLQGALEDLLGVPVDVVPDDSLSDSVRADVRREARPL